MNIRITLANSRENWSPKKNHIDFLSSPQVTACNCN